MSASILGQLQIGYQWIWNAQRQGGAVLLVVQPLPQAQVDAAHLVDVLGQSWSARSPQALLALPPGPLLTDLLGRASADGPAIVVPDQALDDPDAMAALESAAGRGVALLWRGEPDVPRARARPAMLARGIYAITPGQAMLALHAGRQAVTEERAPLEPDQIYEGVGSVMLAGLVLDRYHAWGLAGWPVDDLAQRHRGRPIEPQRATVERLIQLVGADASTDRIESLLLREPLLAWRFLHFANAAGRRRQPVETLRHALMLLGMGQVESWLREQLAGASDDLDLRPLRDALVVRAHLMEQLLDAGDEDNLRHEVMLCGMFSQLELFSGQPLAQVLEQVPLPDRVVAAVQGRQGPYAPYLRVAASLEYPAMHATAALCGQYGLDLADVNRTLLRVLAQARDLTGAA